MKSLWTRSRHACARKPCKLQYLVRVTLKFSRRNGRPRKKIQKHAIVFAHFSSQRLPWPPPPDWSQIAPKWLPDCSQIAPCSLMTSMIPGMISPGDDTTLKCLRYDPKVPKVRPLGPPLNSFQTSLRWLEMKNVIFMKKWNVTCKNALKSHFMTNL